MEQKSLSKDFMIRKDHDKNFKLKDGGTVNGEFLLPCKRSTAHGKTIDKKETTVKEFRSKLNELKRLAPDEFQNMLPYYVE